MVGTKQVADLVRQDQHVARWRARVMTDHCHLPAHSGVTIYLLLLCCKEIFQSPHFQSRPHSKEQLYSITQELGKLRKGDTLVLEDNSTKNRLRFFTWFEGQFFKEYKKVEREASE